MKRIFILIALVLVLLPLSLFATNVQEVIPTNSPIYSMIKALYAEVGFAPPFMSLPMTVGEVEDILSYIPEQKLTSSGKVLLETSKRGYIAHVI